MNDPNYLNILSSNVVCVPQVYKFDSKIIKDHPWFHQVVSSFMLELLYTGPFNASFFHQKCDNVRNTLTVVETTCGSIICGFASTEWKQYDQQANPLACWEKDLNAFVFGPDVPPSKKIVKKF